MTTPTPGTGTAANGSTANGGESGKTADTTSSDTTSPATADQAEPCNDCLPRSPKDDRPFTGCGCSACDTESIEIHCQSEGDKARAKYAEEHQDAPSPKSYEQARLAYGQSRYKVKPILDGLSDKLADSMQEIRCRIDDRDKVACLERSWKRVYKRLRKCRVRGCCVEEASFGVDLDESGVEHLKAQVAKFASVTSRADECFTRLTMEPGLLEARVATAAAQVNSIYYALHPDQAPTPPPTPPPPTPTTPTATTTPAAGGADAPGGAGNGDTAAGDTAKDAASETSEAPPAAEPTDYIRLYALGLVAYWYLDDIWVGYRDIDTFVSCICLAMKVSMAGHRAIAALYGELRVRDARWEERNACCGRLKNHSVDEIIEGYVRCLQDDDECDDCDDCKDGDHHHHHHHRGRGGCEACGDDDGDGDGDSGDGGDGDGDGDDDDGGGDGDDDEDDDEEDDEEDDDTPGISVRDRHRGEESRSRRGERGRTGGKDLEQSRASSRARSSSAESRRTRPTRR
jgi:hypothetical protein